MTVPENDKPKIIYEGPCDIGAALPIPFQYAEPEDVRLSINEIPLEFNIGYSVMGRTATLKVEVAADEKVTVYRRTPLDQQAVFPQNKRFDSLKMNESLDKVCLQQQEQNEILIRTLKVPISTDTVFDGDLPPLQANKALKVKADATGFEYTTLDADQIGQEAIDAAERARVSAEEAEASNVAAAGQAQIATDKAKETVDAVAGFDVHVKEKQDAYDKNALEKTNQFNTNAKNMTDGFNTNAMLKIDDFDAHAMEKEIAFDDNAAAKQALVDASATAAKQSETNAKVSETNAQTSETNAKVSEVAAKASETNATTSEASAKTAALAASQSEQKALASANAAKEVVSTFDQHALDKQKAFDANANNKTEAFNTNANNKTGVFDANAAAKQKLVDTGAANAEASASRAKVSEDNAKVSEQNAATSEYNASISEQNAATSETNAAESEKQARLWAIGTIAERPEGSSEHWADEAKKYADQAAKGQIQSDWNQTDINAKDFIKNKPDVVTRGTNQDINSSKTFLKDQGIKSPLLDIRTDRNKRGNGLIFADKNGTQTAGIGPYVNNNGSPECRLIASNGTVSAFAGLGTTKDGQGFFEIPEPADTSDNNDAVTSAWVNRKLANLPKGNYGIKGDYSSKFGIIKAPTPIIDTKVGSKEITVKAGMMFIAPEDEAIVTVGTDIKYTIQATDKTTLFIADGYVLEAEDVYYQEQEPTDGTHTYVAWYNPKEGPQGTWKFKSNDTGNVWRSAKATPIADVLVTGTNITRIDYIGYVVLNGFTEGSSGSGHMVGELVPFPISTKFTPEGFIKPDGTEFTEGLFPDVWQYYLHPITIGEEQVTILDVCTYEEYAKDVADKGACAKWAVDDVRKTFKIPLMPTGYYLKNGDGTVNKAGLPNITGKISFSGMQFIRDQSGAFSSYTATHNHGTSLGNQQQFGMDFDAARSNQIYGRTTNTVETNAVAVQWFIYVANAQIGQSAIDWSRFETAVASKPNREEVPHLAMPSDKYIELSLGASGTKYVAPANGYIYFSVVSTVASYTWIAGGVYKSSETSNLYVASNNTTVKQSGIHIVMPVLKNKEFFIAYLGNPTKEDFRFIYAEGSI